MKKINSVTNQKMLLVYLQQNGIKLSKKTLGLLKNVGTIPRKYFPLFNLSPRIINFCLKNPVALEDETYEFIMSMSRDYDEATIYHYLKEIIYQPTELIIKATDNRIPKITEKQDFVALMSSNVATADIDLSFDALKYRLFRDEYYAGEIKRINTDAFARKSLANKVAIVEDATEKKKAEIEEKVEELVKDNVTVDDYNLIKAFFRTLLYYDDYESAKQFTKMRELTKYSDVFKAMIQVRNIDEFNIMRQYMIMLVNYINQKDHVYTSNDSEWLGMREVDIPILINKGEELYYKKGYLHICFMLEKIKYAFEKEKEKPYVRRQINDRK